jgi:hypothetical protein
LDYLSVVNPTRRAGEKQKMDGWLTREVYVRLVTEGPQSFQETLWLSLYREGIKTVPFSWMVYLLCYQVGVAVLSILKGL